MNRRRACRALGLGLLPGAAPLRSRPADGALTVFAAASLQNAFEDVGRLHAQRAGAAPRFSFAASSLLARQIEQGAPASVFASADEAWMDHLERRGLLAEGTRRALLGNRLVLVVPAASPLRLELKPGVDLAALLGRDGRWVTGDPGSVPVGRYAQQALTALGAWEAAQGRLVRAVNVRAALALVERGEAAAGIVYATDAALSGRVRVAAQFPPDSHHPVRCPVAVVRRHDAPVAREFLRLLGAPEAAAVFRRHGFDVLG
jgi:molybdate transport system substrate-binding protein